MIECWRLKQGFRHILSSNARRRACKVHFYKPPTLAAYESEFDHANIILHLKVGVSDSVEVIKMSGLAIDCLLILWSLYGSLRCCETDCETDYTIFLSSDTQDIEEDNSDALETAPKTLAFSTALIFFVCV